ncbi:MAG: penicillin-binding protein 2 [Spirochaetia bacterium]|nr:penicillin-binding protein 2 [Spirochaetia bacterium]
MALTAQQYKLWQRLRKRLIAFIVFIIVAFFTLAFRTFQLQVVSGEKYYEQSQRVIRKVVALTAPRGEIYDRNYKGIENRIPIVSNNIKRSLVAIPSHFNSGELITRVGQLERLLKKNEGDLKNKITAQKIRLNEEIILIDDLDETSHTLIADYYITFSKFIIKQSSSRFYNLDQYASHITGYIGPPSRKDMDSGIKSYQLVGKNGIEAQYDAVLRGEDGEIIQIKTARGEIEEQKVFQEAVAGNNLVLTIDAELQKLASESLEGKSGAVIALLPASGEILAMASMPTYNPNIMISADSEERNLHLQEMKKERAEINRAISTKYPPASTFKPLVAFAALEENRLNENRGYFCKGKFTLKSSYEGLPDSTFHCWGYHSHVNLIGALAQSCSTYFYQLGYDIGAEPIIKYSRYFRLNEMTGIDIPGEITGFIPSPLWKEKTFNQRWFDGDTVNLSIGQGFIETTLLGMMNFYSALVTKGVVYKPRLVKEIRFAENDELKQSIDKEILFELPFSNKSLSSIQKGLREAVASGTASRVLNSRGLMPIAGKTGTVQTRSKERFANESQHAWFVGYGPYMGDLQNILLVGVFVERGVAGAVGAAPIAKEIFYEWSRRVYSQEKKAL